MAPKIVVWLISVCIMNILGILFVNIFVMVHCLQDVICDSKPWCCRNLIITNVCYGLPFTLRIGACQGKLVFRNRMVNKATLDSKITWEYELLDYHWPWLLIDDPDIDHCTFSCWIIEFPLIHFRPIYWINMGCKYV